MKLIRDFRSGNVIVVLGLTLALFALWGGVWTTPISQATKRTAFPVLANPLFLTQCVVQPPHDWVSYRIEAGDSLSNLAVKTETQVTTIKQVNCLSSDSIQLNAEIFLPPVLGVTVERPAQSSSPIPKAIPPGATDVKPETNLATNGTSDSNIISVTIATFVVTLFLYKYSVAYVLNHVPVPHSLNAYFHFFYAVIVWLFILALIYSAYGALFK